MAWLSKNCEWDSSSPNPVLLPDDSENNISYNSLHDPFPAREPTPPFVTRQQNGSQNGSQISLRYQPLPSPNGNQPQASRISSDGQTSLFKDRENSNEYVDDYRPGLGELFDSKQNRQFTPSNGSRVRES